MELHLPVTIPSHFAVIGTRQPFVEFVVGHLQLAAVAGLPTCNFVRPFLQPSPALLRLLLVVPIFLYSAAPLGPLLSTSQCVYIARLRPPIGFSVPMRLTLLVRRCPRLKLAS